MYHHFKLPIDKLYLKSHKFIGGHPFTKTTFDRNHNAVTEARPDYRHSGYSNSNYVAPSEQLLLERPHRCSSAPSLDVHFVHSGPKKDTCVPQQQQRS